MVLADDFPWRGQVVEIAADATIAQALDVLTSNGILSAPVYDSKKGRYLGFFDVSDVVRQIQQPHKIAPNAN